MSINLTVGNYKGGVGKTKNAILIPYILSSMGKKCLVIDLDPQGNATTVLARTRQNFMDEPFIFDKTLMGAIKDENLSEIILPVKDNLDLLPSHIDFANYPTYLDLKFGLVDKQNEDYDSIYTKKMNYLNELIKPLSDKYDYIFIDVPPTKSIMTDSAVMASDYVLIILQTQELSLDGAVQYLEDLRNLAEYGGRFDILGVLPVLMDKNTSSDEFILSQANDVFGENNMFQTKVPQMARLKRFDNTGIQEKDRFDKKVIDLYKIVTKEFLDKISLMGELNNEY
ncbi:ParA family protein [Apilactobacillus xinyiensis]|uniref:ParA family protein n=1 Tax=Apilactobacillus xinyiensis TaxID=2841032 RepID=UPI00200FC672|nr:AAA family ATPase [Apilactobacillus xinyiensis]MCL0319401.1 AAA family ATPase [Apilactobacillus xinyiensis]